MLVLEVSYTKSAVHIDRTMMKSIFRIYSSVSNSLGNSCPITLHLSTTLLSKNILYTVRYAPPPLKLWFYTSTHFLLFVVGKSPNQKKKKKNSRKYKSY